MSAVEAKYEMYEPKKLDAIYQNLIANQQVGKTKDYEIRVDDFPVVGRTNDPTRFMGYADFITADTKCVTIYLYRSNGQSDKFFFHLKQDSLNNAEQLGSINTSQKTLSEADMRERLMKDLRYDELVKENAALKAELKEYEEIVEGMNTHLEKVTTGRDKDVMGWIGLIGKGLLGNAVGNMSNENVSGLDNSENSKEGNSSFKQKGVQDVEEEKIIELSEKEQGYLRLLDDIRNKIGDVELANTMHLLDLVASYPPSIHYAIKMITVYIKQHTNPEYNEKV